MENNLKELVEAAHLHIVGGVIDDNIKASSITHYLIRIKDLVKELDRHGMSDDISVEDQRALFSLYVEVENVYGLYDIPNDLANFLMLNAYRYAANATHLSHGEYLGLRREVNNISSIGRFSRVYKNRVALDRNSLDPSPEIVVRMRDVKEFLLLNIGNTMVASLSTKNIEDYLEARDALAQAFQDGIITYERIAKIYQNRIDELVEKVSLSVEDPEYMLTIENFYNFAHVFRAAVSSMSEFQRTDLQTKLNELSLPLIRATRSKLSISAAIARGELRGFLKSTKIPNALRQGANAAFLEEAVYGGYRYRTRNPLGALRVQFPEIFATTGVGFGIGFMAGYPAIGLIAGAAAAASSIPFNLVTVRVARVSSLAQVVNPRRPNAAHLAKEYKIAIGSTENANDKTVKRYLNQIEVFERRVVPDPSSIELNLNAEPPAIETPTLAIA